MTGHRQVRPRTGSAPICSQAEVDAIGLKDDAGGLRGLVVKSTDGRTWTVIVRQLLPDERG